MHLLNYLLQQADNSLILGHRISEWCGHGPILEQDIALINTALDHIGQARNWYQYAAEVFTALPQKEQKESFLSPALEQLSRKDYTEDDLAYLRDAWDFKNVLLVEQKNIDWAYTIARSFFYDHFSVLFYTALQDSKDERLVGIAQKSLKEALYHKKWSSEWMIRLGDGTDESHQKIKIAMIDYWSYTGELFQMTAADKWALEEGIGVDLNILKPKWEHSIAEIIEEATLPIPDWNAWMQQGGKTGTHSEHLGFVLTEMQFIQRTYPNMEW